MNDSDIKKLVAETVADTLLKMGFDTTEPIELQKDMQHLRQWRESIGTIKKQSLTTAVVIVVTGVLGLIWLAIKGTGS